MKKFILLLFALLTVVSVSAQSRSIRGTVVSAADGEPLVGATVVPVGGGSGTATDLDGKFHLTVSNKVSQLTVSYIGMKPVTVPVQDNMTIRLETSDTRLDEVVVTGYGSGKKLGSIVGSVAVIGEQNFENLTTPTFVDALQGQVAGLSIFSSSGDPSSVDNQIRLRGLNSLNAGTTPLFILDGAPVTQTVFTTLNPNDIESITVLKDAASVAIYGSRAANGVIVITSKKGKYGQQARVTIRAKYGWSQLTPDKVDMMNSDQYIEYRDKIGQPVSQGIKDLVNKHGISTNWRDEIFDGSAPTYSLEGAVTGGTERTSYYISLNHLNQEGIIAQSGMRRETMRVSVDSKVTDWFRVGLQTNLGYTKYETNNESGASYSGGGLYPTNPMLFARKALPYDSPYYYTFDDNGNIMWGDRAEYLHYTGMPTPDYIRSGRSVLRNRLTINAALYEAFTPIKGLTLRAQQAVDAYDTRLKNLGFPKETLYTPMGDVYANGGTAGELVTGYNQQSFSRYYSFTYTNTAEYNFNIADVHNVRALVGEESIISQSEGFGVFSEGQSDRRQMLLTQGTSVAISDLSESLVRTVMNSIFAQLSYDYDSKYFFDFTYRRDGSSKFAPGHRWANFFSVGGMWNIKSEKFLQPYTWLDDLKFRISYGTTGNSSIDNYMYYGLIGAGNVYNGQGSLGISQAANSDLTWETVKSFDLGLNFGLFNILDVDVDFYNKQTCDMLLEIPYSYTTGFDGGWGNVGGMRNRGVDVDVKANIINTRDWTWNVRANFNYNKNEITDLYDGLDELPFLNANVIYKVGHDAGSFYCVKYAGVDPRDGQQMWYTKDGNLTKVFNETRDSQILDKSQYSPWSGGFGTDLRWKGLSLRMDFTWAAKKYMINNDLYFITNNNFATSYNQRVEMLNVWTKPGDITDIPAPGQALQSDDRWLEDASFVRLKNLTLQYSLPKAWVKKACLSGVNLHFTGRNLLTFTSFTGYDPEPESNIVAFFYPNTRQYEFGIEVSF